MNRARRKQEAARIDRKASRVAAASMEAQQEMLLRARWLIEQQTQEILRLREGIERQRGMLFGAFLGRALGDEPRLSDAMLEAHPGFFAGHPEAPWLVFTS